MKNQKIILLVIVLLALFSFHNAQRKFYFFVKEKVQSYRIDKNLPELTEQRAKRKHQSARINSREGSRGGRLICFRVE